MALAFFKKDAQYLPIHQEEKIEVFYETQSLNTSTEAVDVCKMTRSFNIKYLLWISWIVISCLVFSNLYVWKKLNDHKIDTVFSPASSSVRYKNIVATSGVLDDISPYQGPPSESTNKLWNDLYDMGISRIPMSDAAQLVNRTVPISNDPGYYVVTLDVFHQLHCLNMIRQRVWSTDGEMPEDGPLNAIHMSHCLDSIRQTLMCASDVTPIPYVWYDYYQMALPTTSVLRTCRDFDAIKDWAKERQSFDFNFTVQVDDPLGNVRSDASPTVVE